MLFVNYFNGFFRGAKDTRVNAGFSKSTGNPYSTNKKQELIALAKRHDFLYY